jgi:hypothetical protein
MPTVVQLNHLRSQLNAIANYFNQGEEFSNAIKALLEYYSDHKSAAKHPMRKTSNLQHLFVPESVMIVVKTHLQLLARENPEAGLNICDKLWASHTYELMSGAIAILSALASNCQKQILERITRWITPQMDAQLMREIQQIFDNNPSILLNSEWIKTLTSWLSDEDDEVKRLGLTALRHTIQSKYENLPHIFSILTPVIQQPSLLIQKELLEVIKSLVQRSQAETASFLIMAGTLFPQKNILAFIRKCLPFFDSYFESEIRSSLS